MLFYVTIFSLVIITCYWSSRHQRGLKPFFNYSMAGEELVEVMVVVGKMGLLLERSAQKDFMVSSVRLVLQFIMSCDSLKSVWLESLYSMKLIKFLLI